MRLAETGENDIRKNTGERYIGMYVDRMCERRRGVLETWARE